MSRTVGTVHEANAIFPFPGAPRPVSSPSSCSQQPFGTVMWFARVALAAANASSNSAWRIHRMLTEMELVVKCRGRRHVLSEWSECSSTALVVTNASRQESRSKVVPSRVVPQATAQGKATIRATPRWSAPLGDRLCRKRGNTELVAARR